MSRTSPGRPRSDATREALLAAAFELLVERGYAAMTIEAVAARAGAGKATIYRWWPTRADLAVEAFFARTEPELRFPDTGSARGDFRAQLLALGAVLRAETGAAMRAMLGGAVTDPALGDAIRTRWIGARRGWGEARLRAAIASGEASHDLNIAAALAALYGPVYAPLFFGMGVPDEAMLAAIVDVVLDGIFGRETPPH